MAKKKKEPGIELDVLNTIGSKGNVKIKVYNNDKLYKIIEKHNTGTGALCNYIRDVVIGLSTTINQPSVIKPCTKLASGELVPISNQGVDFVSRWRGADYSYESTAVIKFIIPWPQLSIGGKIDGFQLSSRNKELDYYAYVELDDPIIIAEHTNIEVEWSIKINIKGV